MANNALSYLKDGLVIEPRVWWESLREHLSKIWAPHLSPVLLFKDIERWPGGKSQGHRDELLGGVWLAWLFLRLSALACRCLALHGVWSSCSFSIVIKHWLLLMKSVCPIILSLFHLTSSLKCNVNEIKSYSNYLFFSVASDLTSWHKLSIVCECINLTNSNAVKTCTTQCSFLTSICLAFSNAFFDAIFPYICYIWKVLLNNLNISQGIEQNLVVYTSVVTLSLR